MIPAPGERYTIRRKVFRLFGAGFHIYGPQGELVGFCNQKAFRLRESLMVYTDDSRSTELFHIGTEQIIDFGATYYVTLPTGERIGSCRRKGIKSMFRDEWEVFDGEGKSVGVLMEDSGTLAMLRRVHEAFAALCPEKYVLRRHDGREIATLRTHFNWFIYRLGVGIREDDSELDDLMILALGCLIAAVEGRQDAW